MSAVPDEADKHAAGTLPKDPKAGARPLNGAAQKRAELEPRILTVREILEQSAVRTRSKTRPHSCTTGIASLDDCTGGLRQGHVWVFGAETNWGKSSWLVMVADENLKKGKKVLIVSSEDDESIYGDRLLARRGRLNFKRLRDGILTFDEHDRVKHTINRAEASPVYLDARSRKVELVVKQVERVIKEHAIDCVLYDYLQEFRSGVAYKDRRAEFADVAAALRGVVKTAGKTGIIFSQITVQEGKKYPDKNSIRESRDVSNAAEVVLLGFTPTENLVDGSGKEAVVRILGGTRTIFVDKVKDGPKGFLVPLAWDGGSACFDAMDANDNPVPHEWVEAN